MINDVLLEHVGLPHVLVLAVHLAHVILVSALGPNPNPSFFLFWGTFIQLEGLLGQGPGLGLGPGLDNKSLCSVSYGTDNIHYDSRELLTQTQILNDTLEKKVLSIGEKLEFLKTSVSWISSKDIMDTCFVLNYGYEASLPWPQV